ncbi:MAG: ribonuclease III [Chromatiales bacterium]|nr:ribonuclease III [Chromatiales bacterium]
MASSPLRELLDEAVLASSRFQQAITHRSAGGRHNERLEFLGDSVLGLVISAYLHENCPDCDEGGLSRLRASLVKKESLAELGRDLALGDWLRLGAGELKSGGFRRDSTLADALEAIIGAVFLERGFAEARDFVLALYRERLASLPSVDDLKDPKTRLQEFLQGREQELPSYEVIDVRGKPHNQKFTARCLIPALDIVTEGEGSSRRKAEQAAATEALHLLQEKKS